MNRRRLVATCALAAPLCLGACRFNFEITTSEDESASLGGSRSGAGTFELPLGDGGTTEHSGGAGGVSSGGTGGTETLPDDWWDGEFRTRVRIDIDNSSLAEGLTGFPIALKLTGGAYDPSKSGNGGDALRFVDGDHATELPYEIEDGASLEESTIWIRIPELTAAPTEQSIWLYYDNPDAGPGEQPPLVWSTDYLAVYHFNGSLEDSTGNMLDASGTNTSFDVGQTNEGVSLNGVDSNVIPPNPSLLDNFFAGGGTASLWNRPDTTGNSSFPRLFEKSTSVSADDGWALQQYPELALFRYRLEFDFSVARGVWETSEVEDYGDFRSTVLTFDSLNATTPPSIYVNGVARTITELETPDGAPVDDSAQELYLGNFPDNSRAFDGSFDEARFSSVIRSAAWLAAEHRCMDSGCASVSSEVDTLD